MVLRLLEDNRPLTDVVFYDTGMEYRAIYNNLAKVSDVLKANGITVTVLRPDTTFLQDMLIRPVKHGKPGEHYGYAWCGGVCRWQTAMKVTAINKYLSSIGDYMQYVGIAYDEPKRIKEERNKIYPLVEWQMTERDCLEYCYSRGYNWIEDGVELYSILDRVSCWCCANKNIKELRNIYRHLPRYWGLLEGMQSKIDRPFKRGHSIFELRDQFKKEGEQLEIDDA